MRSPNFFIVGGPKCGTTALSHYLEGHPHVFVARNKELHYFNTDFSETYRCRIGNGLCRTDEEYIRRFADANDAHVALGEASPWYLASDVAIANIRRFNPQAKIIVMLRNPVEMAPAIHGQELYDGSEIVRDFRAAWELQDARQQGVSLPKKCLDSKILQFRDACLLGKQLQRLFTIFPRRQVLAIVFDDFVADTRRAYEETLAFLGVPSDGRVLFPKVNVRKQHRLRILNDLLLTSRKSRFLDRLARTVKKTLGLRSLGIRPLVQRYNTRPPKKRSIAPEFRQALVETFADDVRLLEQILGRKLDAWRNVE